MRRCGTEVWSGDWRRLITLACLLAFVFVATAHAGQHAMPIGENAALSVLSAPSDGADDGEASDADRVCLICALAVAEIVSVDMSSYARAGDRVERPAPALATRPIPAESPPPIA